MRRAFAIASVFALLVLAAVVHTSIKDFLWAHPWWHSAIVALPTIALAVFAYFESLHAAEANTLRADANVLRSRIADLEAERNRHLQQIAKNTQRPRTLAERNADILRKHLRAKVSVTEGEGQKEWGNPAEIVQVGDDNIVTLFTSRGHSSSAALCINVQCGDVEITEMPQGACPLRLHILKRYGTAVQLGEITKWEDRTQPAATPTFAKSGGASYYAIYTKPGSPEKRNIYVFASRDVANSFLLEASTGENTIGDNINISKRVLSLQIDYEAMGFTRTNASGGTYPLFIRT